MSAAVDIKSTTLIGELLANAELEAECAHCLRARTLQISELKNYAFLSIDDLEDSLRCNGCGRREVRIFTD